MNNEPEIVVPIDVRESTLIDTDQGIIHVIHEITLGEVITSTLLIMLLLYLIISNVARRF